ncbi:F-box/FBD/LRR-repeat protein [Carex littledalei]|uniref:F-box/FBD/LRR-repeat protein n=1 Tax=Carex littledalei TaxID=544730 RepID=A0A833VKL0_9POAL|nr:F-box/FBD/LRR-repeat protein [Carex littledalei]
MFNSETLEDLNLSIDSIDKGIGSRAINFPRLKKLQLCVESDDSDILNKLALGCPALEDLYLDNCFMNIRVISFPKLKYLNISSWEDEWVECIRAPNLVSLVLDGWAKLFKKTSFEKMPSLMNATISLRGWYRFYVEKCNLLHAVANVQNLELSWSTIQHECDLEADQGSNSIKSPLFQCKNLDEIEVELKCINVGTKQLVNTLVESLAELKTTRLILSFHYNWPDSPSLTELHQFCLSMVQGKDVLTLLSDNKFIVWSKLGIPKFRVAVVD